jgi:uncharacterized protein
MRLFSYAACAALAAYLIAALALFLMQDRMLLPATPEAADLRASHHPGDDIDVFATNGAYAGFVVTPAAGAPRGTVIVYHGNEESAETKLPLADVFVRAGYRSVIVEYPGHGRRSGARTMKAAVAAAREAFAATRARWPGPVWLVGESLGAGMAAQVVDGNEADIEGVVLITPWDSLADVAAEQYPMFPVRWMLHDTFDSVAAVSRFRGPLVVVGAQRDTLIPVAHAQRFAREHASTHFMLLPEADHDDWFEKMTPQDWRQILQWLHAA